MKRPVFQFGATSAAPARQLGSISTRYSPTGLHREQRKKTPFLQGFPAASALVGTDFPASPTARSAAEARVEAVLFLARQPIPSRRLAQLANLTDGTESRSLVKKLSKKYDLGGSAFNIEEVAGGFQILTRRKFMKWLNRLEGIPSQIRLSGPAMETLAVVAYQQPVLRVDIEAIRGVQCGEILRQLMERDLVRIAGRAEELGRPFLYGTTKRFMQVFGLRHLEELPRAEELRFGPTSPSDEVAIGTLDSNDNQSLEESSDWNKEKEVSAVILTAQEKEGASLAPIEEESKEAQTIEADYDSEDDDYYEEDDWDDEESDEEEEWEYEDDDSDDDDGDEEDLEEDGDEDGEWEYEEEDDEEEELEEEEEFEDDWEEVDDEESDDDEDGEWEYEEGDEDDYYDDDEEEYDEFEYDEED